MKKTISIALLVVLLLMLSLPLQASAYGGYYVIKGEKVYHYVACSDVIGYDLETLKFYETEKKAKNAGFKPADCCVEDGYDYESDDSTFFYSSDNKTQNALEMERLFGVFDGYDAGYEEAYDIGYDEGFAAGEEAAHQETAVDYEEVNSKPNSYTPYIVIAIIAFVLGYLVSGKKQADEIRLLHAENLKYEALLKIYEMDNK